VKPRSSGRKPCSRPSGGPRNSIAPQSKQKQVVKKTLSASHLPCVSAPPASLYGECGACWLDASSISRQCLLGRIIINRPMSAVSLGEGVLMRRLRATTETNALGFLSLPPLASLALAAAAAAAQAQLSAVVGAGCSGLERASTDGGAQCAEMKSNSQQQRILNVSEHRFFCL